MDKVLFVLIIALLCFASFGLLTSEMNDFQIEKEEAKAETVRADAQYYAVKADEDRKQPVRISTSLKYLLFKIKSIKKIIT